MEKMKHHWKRVPDKIRRPIVLIVGSIFIIAAALTGWLPGPGGVPLFLVGIAILATEFERAERFRDWLLGYLHGFGNWYRKHRLLGTTVIVITALFAVVIGLLCYRKLA